MPDYYYQIKEDGAWTGASPDYPTIEEALSAARKANDKWVICRSDTYKEVLSYDMGASEIRAGIEEVISELYSEYRVRKSAAKDMNEKAQETFKQTVDTIAGLTDEMGEFSQEEAHKMYNVLSVLRFVVLPYSKSLDGNDADIARSHVHSVLGDIKFVRQHPQDDE